MARFVSMQTNFTSGELDPLVRARVDIASYNNALETAQNVICQPQGGVTRRPGTKFINELTGSPSDIFDKSYPTTQGDFQLNYAYRVPLNYDNMYLSFG